MEILATVGLVGLVGSLMGTCEVLEEFALRFATERSERDFLEFMTTLRSSYRDTVAHYYRHLPASEEPLFRWQNSKEPDSLTTMHNDIERHINKLKENIQNVDLYGRKLFLNNQKLSQSKRDIAEAMSRIDLALNLVKVMRTLHYSINEDKPSKRYEYEFLWPRGDDGGAINRRKDISWLPSNDMLSLTKDLSANRCICPQRERDTAAARFFAQIESPEPQHVFHDHCRAERGAGACEWFLSTNEFQLWERGLDRECILWCYGRPGVGKTILASKAIDHLRESQHVALVAFCYMSSGRMHSAVDLVASLLKQTCLLEGFMPEYVKKVFVRSEAQAHPRVILENLLEAFERYSKYCGSRPIRVVVDGFDKDNMVEQRDFVRVLASLKKSRIRCLLFSRPEQDVLFPALNGCPKLPIENVHLVDDIRDFIDGAIRGDGTVYTMLKGEPLRSDVVMTLSSCAQGMFQWAALQVRFILDQTDLPGIRKALQETPRDIRGIVEKAMDVISQQKEARAQLARRALALLAIVKHPINSGAICHALGMANALNTDEQSSELGKDHIPSAALVIECCQGLLAVDPVTKIVTIAHYDIESYMRKNWDALFTLEERSILTNVPVAYLLLDTFLSGPCYRRDEFERRLEDYPFLDYASQYWGYHARRAFLLPSPEKHVIRYVACILAKRSSLESSLQVLSMSSKSSTDKSRLFRTPDQFASHAKKTKSASELQVAIRHGLEWVVRDCILREPEMAWNQDSFGTSALHEAARAGWFDVVEMLLKAGAQPLLADENGKSPLYYAAMGGHGNVKAGLLKWGDGLQSPIKPSVLESFGARSYVSREDPEYLQEASSEREIPHEITASITMQLKLAFCDAVKAGNPDVVEQMLEDRERIELDKQGTEVLVLAIDRGHEAVLQVLLDAGVDPSCPDLSLSEQIPLHRAMRHNNAGMADRLLDHGAKLQTLDHLNRTALFESVNSSSADGAALLVGRGIDLSAVDHLDETFLHKAAANGSLGHAELVSGHAGLLNDQGKKAVEVDSRNKEGLTPLHFATRYDRYHIVDLLLRHHADINAATYNTKETPLMYAVSAGSGEVCNMLLCLGADVNAVSNDGKTPISLAAAGGHLDIAKKLLSHGAHLQPEITGAEDPLKAAAISHYHNVLGLLINNGADPKLSNFELKRPQRSGNHPRLSDHEYVVKVLKNHGASVSIVDED